MEDIRVVEQSGDRKLTKIYNSNGIVYISEFTSWNYENPHFNPVGISPKTERFIPFSDMNLIQKSDWENVTGRIVPVLERTFLDDGQRRRSSVGKYLTVGSVGALILWGLSKLK